MREVIQRLLRAAGGIAPLRAVLVAVIRAAIRLIPAGRTRDVLLGPVTSYLLPRDYRAPVSLPGGTRLNGSPLDIVTRMILYFGTSSRGCWEPRTSRLAAAIARSGGDVIVGGAHIGYFAISLAREVGATSARVFAFEPVAVMHAELLRNAALNQVPNLVVERKALGGRSGTGRLYVQGVRSSLVRPLKGPTDRQETIEMTSIDEYVDGHRIARLALLFLDIEGAELQALKGAERLLCRPDAPDVLFEIVLAAETSGASIEEYLRTFGYCVFYIDDDYHLELRHPAAPLRVWPLHAAPAGHRYFNALATRRPERLAALGVQATDVAPAS